MQQPLRASRGTWRWLSGQFRTGEDALDRRWRDDGGDHLERGAAVRAVFEVEREDALGQPSRFDSFEFAGFPPSGR